MEAFCIFRRHSNILLFQTLHCLEKALAVHYVAVEYVWMLFTSCSLGAYDFKLSFESFKQIKVIFLCFIKILVFLK